MQQTYKIWARNAGGGSKGYGLNLPAEIATSFDMKNDRFIVERKGNTIIYTRVKLVLDLGT